MNIILETIDKAFWYKMFNYTPYIQNNMDVIVKQLYDEFQKFYKEKDPMQHKIYMLQDNGQIVGYKYFYYNPDTKFAKLFSTSVDKKYRRKGYARNMIEQTLNFLQQNDINHIEIPLVKDQETKQYLLKELYEKIKPKYQSIKIDVLFG